MTDLRAGKVPSTCILASKYRLIYYEFGSLLCSEVRVCGVVSPTGQRSRTRRPALLLVGVVGYFGCDYEGWCTRCSSDVRLIE